MTISKYAVSLCVLLALNACASNEQDNVSVEDAYYVDDFDVSASADGASVERTSSETAAAPRLSYIGRKIETIRREVEQLQQTVKENEAAFKNLKETAAVDSAKYYENIAYINARLQNGTTQGNPELYEKWRQAAAQVDLLDKNATAMAGLSTQVSNDSDMVAYLLNAVRSTFAISGAVDAEHDALKKMEDEVSQVSVLVGRLKGEVNTQVARQQQYVTNERRNMTTLAMAIRDGQLFGVNLSDPTMIPSASAAPAVIADATVPEFHADGRRPLVKIPFDGRKIAYEQPLYQAVKAALAKKPDVTFELVAACAAGQKTNYEAIKNAETVLHSLMEMGLPAGRVSLAKISGTTLKNNEVRLYIK